MQRREFLQTMAAGGLAAEKQGSARSRRPNFLFLIADDLTFRGIHSLNNHEIQTPSLDRLVRRGCAFTSCYHQGSWSAAVCIASRTMLNTGLTCFRAHRLSEEATLWPQTMGSAGYDTHIVGKWHLSQANLRRAFKTMGPVSPGMFESGPEAYNRPSPGNTWNPWDKTLNGQWLHTARWQKAARDGIKHSAEIWADCAIHFLRNRREQKNPFFLYVGFNSPHDPRQAPKEYIDRYPAREIEIPPNYLPRHPFDQGDPYIRDEKLAPFPRTREAVQLHRSEYYAHTTYMDAQIGRILDALEASGQAANTFVIFTADHGLAVGQHGLMGKQNMYDHSIRMPLLITGPGLPSGRRINQLVYQHSVYPTTCELAGVPIPKSAEFPSLAKLLRGSGTAIHESIFSFYLGFQRALRTESHKLIVYPKAGVVQLFDLNNDPWEVHNLAGEPRHAALQAHLLGLLRQQQKELDDVLVL